MTKKEKDNQYLKRVTKKENDLIRELNKQYKIAYVETLNKMREYHALYNVDGKFSYEEMVKYNRLKALNEKIAEEIKELYKNNKKIINDELGDNFLEAYNYTGFILETESQTKLNFMLLPKDTITQAIQNPLSGLTLNETLAKNEMLIKSKIRQQLIQAIIQGESITKASERIKRAVDIDFNSATRIARTEINRTANAGQEMAYERAKQYGLEFTKVWVATLDGRTRDTHRDLDGQEADADGYFIVDGHKAKHPGGFGVASLDINCRCGTIAKDEDLAMRKDNVTKEIIPYQTYREWEDNRLKKG